MNFNDIINDLAANPGELEKKDDRRGMLKGIGSKLAAAAVPFALGSLFTNEAHGQSKETINNVLNYILKNEQIIDKILSDAMKVDGLVPSEFRTQFETIHANNRAHMQLIKEEMAKIGGVPVEIDPAKVDYAGGSGSGGQFYKAMTVTDDFLVLMQVLTETILRIYKGQIYEVLSDKYVVRMLSCIHSAKARQSAFIRYMRNYWMGEPVKPWITNTESDTDNPSAQTAYAGESNTIHAGIQTVRINGLDITQEWATQAFDEPFNKLDSDKVMNRFMKL